MSDLKDKKITCKCGNNECLGFSLLHEKELKFVNDVKECFRIKYGDVDFELKVSPSSGEIFTKFYELHIIANERTRRRNE